MGSATILPPLSLPATKHLAPTGPIDSKAVDDFLDAAENATPVTRTYMVAELTNAVVDGRVKLNSTQATWLKNMSAKITSDAVLEEIERGGFTPAEKTPAPHRVAPPPDDSRPQHYAAPGFKAGYHIPVKS